MSRAKRNGRPTPDDYLPVCIIRSPGGNSKTSALSPYDQQPELSCLHQGLPEHPEEPNDASAYQLNGQLDKPALAALLRALTTAVKEEARP